jgi:pimeloyl-ACP methyl ester carboxylesterase
MTDLDLARLAAAAYDPTPVGTIVDWYDVRAVVTGRVCAVRGTVPDNFQNWLRDLAVHPIPLYDHPRLGLCAAGAVEAAEALAARLPPEVNTFIGHSLGGQIAGPLAGIRADAGRPVVALVTFDAPKSGGPQLSALLAAVAVRGYRFRGSEITLWPPTLHQHVREPLIDVGDWTPDPILAHSIDRAVAWMAAREAVAA